MAARRSRGRGYADEGAEVGGDDEYVGGDDADEDGPDDEYVDADADGETPGGEASGGEQPRGSRDADDEGYDEDYDEGYDEDAGGGERSRATRSRRGSSGRAHARPEGDRMSAAGAAQAGLRQIAELTGKRPEGVTAVEPSDDGGWVVGVEVLEDRRVPSTSDMLATYRAEVSADGALMSYRRLGRYPRGRGDDGGGSG